MKPWPIFFRCNFYVSGKGICGFLQNQWGKDKIEIGMESMMSKESFIEIKEIVKKYGKHIAVDHISFDINKGEIFGLLGPNGAGKSTLIAMLATASKPTAGEILIAGKSLQKNQREMKKMIGFVPQEIALYTQLSGMDNLRFWGQVYGLRGGSLQQAIDWVLPIIGLEKRIKDKVVEYSGGMKRRLNIAVALLHRPAILILDEPTVGVDVYSCKRIMEAIKALAVLGSTVIMASHYLDQLEETCHRVAILAAGKIKALGTVEELADSLQTYAQDWD